MSNLYDTPRLNAEGYCRKCGAPLGISGQCPLCAINELDKRFKPKTYILGAPAHELAAEVQRDLYEQARSGVVDYGALSPIHELILQFQESASNMNQILSGLQNTVNELAAENNRLKGNTPPVKAWLSIADKVDAEQTLRKQLVAARFPTIEDVFVAKAHFFYATFEELLTREQIMFAESALHLKIERIQPLRNRYRIVFQAPDVEEE